MSLSQVEDFLKKQLKKTPSNPQSRSNRTMAVYTVALTLRLYDSLIGINDAGQEIGELEENTLGNPNSEKVIKSQYRYNISLE